MKKILCSIVLACLVISAAFAQQKTASSAASSDKKNALGVDVYHLIKGEIDSDRESNITHTTFALCVNYERLVAPHFSVGADVHSYFGKISYPRVSIDTLLLTLAFEGRYYPISTGLDKFFLGTTAGFVSYWYDGSNSPSKGGYTGLLVSIKAGYKLILKDVYLEPSMSFKTMKANATTGASYWEPGLRFGFLF